MNREDMLGRTTPASYQEDLTMKAGGVLLPTFMMIKLRAAEIQKEIFNSAARKLGAEDVDQIHRLGLLVTLDSLKQEFIVTENDPERDRKVLTDKAREAAGKKVLASPMDMDEEADKIFKAIIEMVRKRYEDANRVARELGFENAHDFGMQGLHLVDETDEHGTHYLRAKISDDAEEA